MFLFTELYRQCDDSTTIKCHVNVSLIYFTYCTQSSFSTLTFYK
uniref:Uncharacterized protein n=1 Tax=Anguilla anguilla TaxID=7936 RepID=A0A0E9PPI7_ANGAN